jgi:hypothetical protein
MLTVRQTEQLGKVINLDNRDTSRRFNESEKQELIEYLHVACDEDNHKQFLKDNPLGEFTDYVDASQDNESMYSQFVVRFVDLLNLNHACHRRNRMLVRKQWKQRSLPKCKVKAVFDYVAICITRPEDQARAKRYIDKRIDSTKEFERVALRIKALQNALHLEDESLKREFKFPPLSENIAPILELISACLDAIGETQRARRSSYSEQRYNNLRFALQKIQAARALANPHSDMTSLSSEQVCDMMPVIHEAIAGKFPNGNDFYQYSTANVAAHANRLNAGGTRAKLDEIIEGVREKFPDAKTSSDDNTLNGCQPIPKKIPVSSDGAAIQLLCGIHGDYMNSHDPIEFVRRLNILVPALRCLLTETTHID